MDFYNKVLKTNKVFIIGEAGVNHNGCRDLAFKLVDAAKEANCDAIKFQTFVTEEVISRQAEKASYQQVKTDPTESQFEMIKKLELSEDEFTALAKYCKKKEILFVSTPCDKQSVDFLDRLYVPFFKIGSGEVTNLPFLRYVAEKQKPIVLSTGMATIAEIRLAVKTVYQTGNKSLALLHCATAYPLPFGEANLRAIVSLRENFSDAVVGYSDHTLGIDIPLAAVALGAKIIEKHFTLDKNMTGPDHQASLDPEGLARMVQGIRNVEQSLGDGVKRLTASEKMNIGVVRRSVVAVRDIKKGSIISDSDISLKRPGWGIQPKDISEVIGAKAICDIERDEPIIWEKIK